MNNLCVTVVVCCFLTTLIPNAAGQRCNGGVECITLNECTGLYNQLQRGTNAQLTRLLRSLHCGFQFDQPMICCPPQFKYDTTTSSYDPPPMSDQPYRPRPSDQASRNGNAESLLPKGKECGIQNNDRIVGGIGADIDEHPWLALIRYDKPMGSGFYCGGVLISSRYVMTAAHCVKGQDLPTNWRLSQVRLGEWNTSSINDCVMDDCAHPVQDVPVEETIAHEDYNPQDSNQHHDIALLRLARPAKFSDFVQPICLPVTPDTRNKRFEGYNMEVAGWGKTETRSQSDVKLKVTVPVVNTNECASVYNRVERQIIDKQLCAGGNAGQDSCRGDSGGALMGRTGAAQNWFAVGVVSYGPSPCGTPGWPGVYTRVGAYTDWILSKLRP
ncbi:CLIP domain-containing serine protease HP8 [Pectinophora gossypiella]|uniref:CLIP domain-containing serine protease HP8 n=1 Tax=Pectinophora gossypiella TaxID=13191 RepID=UPI00214F4E9B|nr:CLIP domain-containing serine protease HP8 [Pectinophora gossypiella]